MCVCVFEEVMGSLVQFVSCEGQYNSCQLICTDYVC